MVLATPPGTLPLPCDQSVLKYLWSQGADTTRHGPGHALCAPTSLCGRQPNCGTGLAESKQQQPGAGRGDHPSPGSEVPAKARTPFCRKKTHWNVQHHSPGRVQTETGHHTDPSTGLGSDVVSCPLQPPLVGPDSGTGCSHMVHTLGCRDASASGVAVFSPVWRGPHPHTRTPAP